MDRILAENRALGCDTVAGLNEIVRSGKIGALIDASLAAYERSLDEAAAKVMARLRAGDPLRMLWVSGPSSSGKTTTTVKLIRAPPGPWPPLPYVESGRLLLVLVEHPTDWINDRNYETPEAMDIQLLNKHLRQLLEGDEIDKPIYSFKKAAASPASPFSWPKTRFYSWTVCTALSPDHGRHRAPGPVPGLYRNPNVMFEGDGKFTTPNPLHRYPIAPTHVA